MKGESAAWGAAKGTRRRSSPRRCALALNALAFERGKQSSLAQFFSAISNCSPRQRPPRRGDENTLARGWGGCGKKRPLRLTRRRRDGRGGAPARAGGSGAPLATRRPRRGFWSCARCETDSAHPPLEESTTGSDLRRSGRGERGVSTKRTTPPFSPASRSPMVGTNPGFVPANTHVRPRANRGAAPRHLPRAGARPPGWRPRGRCNRRCPAPSSTAWSCIARTREERKSMMLSGRPEFPRETPARSHSGDRDDQRGRWNLARRRSAISSRRTAHRVGRRPNARPGTRRRAAKNGRCPAPLSKPMDALHTEKAAPAPWIARDDWAGPPPGAARARLEKKRAAGKRVRTGRRGESLEHRSGAKRRLKGDLRESRAAASARGPRRHGRARAPARARGLPSEENARGAGRGAALPPLSSPPSPFPSPPAPPAARAPPRKRALAFAPFGLRRVDRAAADAYFRAASCAGRAWFLRAPEIARPPRGRSARWATTDGASRRIARPEARRPGRVFPRWLPGGRPGVTGACVPLAASSVCHARFQSLVSARAFPPRWPRRFWMPSICQSGAWRGLGASPTRRATAPRRRRSGLWSAASRLSPRVLRSVRCTPAG